MGKQGFEVTTVARFAIHLEGLENRASKAEIMKKLWRLLRGAFDPHRGGAAKVFS
jgi:hypothetical protein